MKKEIDVKKETITIYNVTHTKLIQGTLMILELGAQPNLTLFLRTGLLSKIWFHSKSKHAYNFPLSSRMLGSMLSLGYNIVKGNLGELE